MMIGPAPMIRMLWMSVRLPTLLAAAHGHLQLRLQAAQDEVIEQLEQRLEVVRSGARLGVPLETECRAVLEGDALQRAVEQRAVRRPDVVRQRRLIDGEAVILAGDEDAAAVQVLHRMV